MITIKTRPLAFKEKWQLRAMSRAPAEETIIVPFFVFCGVTVLMTLAVVLVKSRFPAVDRFENALIVTSIAFAFASALWIRERNIRKLSPPSLRSDIESGAAEILSVNTKEILRVQQYEDEGIGFLINSGDGKVIYLQGQHLEQLEKRRIFPCQTFEVVRSAHSQTFLDLKCIGAYLPPLATIGPFSPDNKLPENGQIIQADFEEIKKRPNKAFEA